MVSRQTKGPVWNGQRQDKSTEVPPPVLAETIDVTGSGGSIDYPQTLDMSFSLGFGENTVLLGETQIPQPSPTPAQVPKSENPEIAPTRI